MKLFLILIINTVILISCTDKPKDVLTRQQMASVLIEMYIRESEINEIGLRPDSANILHQMMLNRTLEKRNISEDTYLKSYDYYINNLKRFDEVYAIVIDSLKLRETLAQQQPATAPVETDPSNVMVPTDSLVEDSVAIYSIGPNPPTSDSTLFLLPFDSISDVTDSIPPVEPGK